MLIFEVSILFFKRKFKSIQSKQQYKQYKLEFDQTYTEYVDLYEQMKCVSKSFETHQQEMEKMDQSSKEFDEKKTKILKDYTEKISDQEYLKKKDRYEYLDSKLRFISELARQYQQSNNIQNNNL